MSLDLRILKGVNGAAKHEGEAVMEPIDMAKQYTIRIEQTEETGEVVFFAYSDAFPGIENDGDTPEKAISGLQLLLADVIEHRLSSGRKLPPH